MIALSHTLTSFAVSVDDDLPIPVHPLLRSLSPITFAQLLTAAMRVERDGPREIKVYEGMVVSGLEDYLACCFLKLAPALTTIEKPRDVGLYILGDHVPRTVESTQRAAMAARTVEFFREETLKKRDAGVRSDPPQSSGEGPSAHEREATAMAARTAHSNRAYVETFFAAPGARKAGRSHRRQSSSVRCSMAP